ncbi:hypothetical protein [Streptomyces sp. 1222.5]|uniref:hypothetical protein n=1 Tax=Streptomyces sp. 1222.5 TaxID=1881026 RepID=UPI003D71FE5A
MALTPRRPAPTATTRRGNALFVAIIAAVVVLGGVLVWLNASQQDRLATVRQSQVSGQKTATGQRTDQTQLTCALWALLRDGKTGTLPGSVRDAADKICADVPTPTAKN